MMQRTWDWKYVFEILISVLLDKNPNVELLDHTVARFFHFLRSLCTVFHSTILHFHQQCARISVFLQPHQHFFVCLLISWYFYNDHPFNGCEVICHYGFFFLMINDCEHLLMYFFIYLLAICISSLEKFLFKSFEHIWLCSFVFFLLLNLRSFFFILDNDSRDICCKYFFLVTPLIILFTVILLVYSCFYCLVFDVMF